MPTPSCPRSSRILYSSPPRPERLGDAKMYDMQVCWETRKGKALFVPSQKRVRCPARPPFVPTPRRALPQRTAPTSTSPPALQRPVDGPLHRGPRGRRPRRRNRSDRVVRRRQPPAGGVVGGRMSRRRLDDLEVAERLPVEPARRRRRARLGTEIARVIRLPLRPTPGPVRRRVSSLDLARVTGSSAGSGPCFRAVGRNNDNRVPLGPLDVRAGRSAPPLTAAAGAGAAVRPVVEGCLPAPCTCRDGDGRGDTAVLTTTTTTTA